MTDYTPDHVCRIDSRIDPEQLAQGLKAQIQEAHQSMSNPNIQWVPFKPRSPATLAFWKRLWQNYRIGRDACHLRRLKAIKDAWMCTRMGC